MVQPPADLDPYARLGLPVALHVDAQAVVARRIQLLDAVHPDRFAAHRDEARAYALQQAVAINDAARTLADPVRRAEALMRQRRWSAAQTPPGEATRLQLSEYTQAIDELRGIDAHTERQAMERALAGEAREALDALFVALAPAAADRDAAIAALARLRGIQDAERRLAQLDTTPDRSGRSRR